MKLLNVILCTISLLIDGTLSITCKNRSPCKIGTTIEYNCNGTNPKAALQATFSNQTLKMVDCNLSNVDIRTVAKKFDFSSIKIIYSLGNTKKFPLDVLIKDVPSLCKLEVKNSKTGGHFQMKFQALPLLTTFLIENHDFDTFANKPFRNLSALEKLQLKNGQLGDLPNDIFHGLDGLIDLDLTANRITKIRRNIFSNLGCLNNLYLSRNKLKQIDSITFSGLNKLEILQLDGNQLKELPKELFKYVPLLSSLIVEGNLDISIFPDGFFRGVTLLNRLYVSHCYIQALKPSLFSDTDPVSYNLKSRSMSVSTKIQQSLDLRKAELPSSFYNTSYLGRISKQRSSHGLGNLQVIDLSWNQLKEIQNGTFASLDGLNELDLSYNPLTSLPEFLPFGPNTLLYGVNLSHCNFSVIPNIRWSLVDLRRLDVSYNRIKDVNLCVYSKKPTEVMLDYNEIGNIQLDFRKNASSSPMYSFFGNSLVCDCELKTFLQFLHSPRQKSHQVFSEVSIKQKCRSPNHTLSLMDVKTENLSCLIGGCLKNCVCNQIANQKIDLNCSSQNFTRIPSILPPNVTIVRLRNNDITSLLVSDTSWEEVTHLYLDENCLKSMENWMVPSALRVLSLVGNQLEDIPQNFREKVDSTANFSLYLFGNNWKCNCGSVSLIEWIKESNKITDYENLTCSMYENATGINVALLIKALTPNKICPDPPSTSTNDVPTIISVSLPTILTILCGLFYVYRHRHSVLAVMHAYDLYCEFLDRNREPEERMYDCFLCYVPEDNYLAKSIARRMEPEFVICMHERDWTLGGDTSQKILHSLQNSRTTLMLLSRNFLLSSWFQEDFRTAYSRMPEDFHLRVVSIFIGDVKGISYLPPDLSHLLSLKTHIKWKERFFWAKLRFALRSPPKASQ